jgi:hypothetical protein
MLERVADVRAEPESSMRVDVGFDALLDRRGNRVVVSDPILEVIAVREECVDLVKVVV